MATKKDTPPNPVGRPTKYSPDTLKKTRDYIDNYEKYGDVIPMLCGLAIHLSISKDTIFRWINEEDKVEFSDLAAECMTSQEKALMNGGIKGDFNASITKLALTKHGYSDKTDATVVNTGSMTHIHEGIPFGKLRDSSEQ